MRWNPGLIEIIYYGLFVLSEEMLTHSKTSQYEAQQSESARQHATSIFLFLKLYDLTQQEKQPLCFKWSQIIKQEGHPSYPKRVLNWSGSQSRKLYLLRLLFQNDYFVQITSKRLMVIFRIGSRCLPFFSDVLRKIMSAGTRWFCIVKRVFSKYSQLENLHKMRLYFKEFPLKKKRYFFSFWNTKSRAPIQLELYSSIALWVTERYTFNYMHKHMPFHNNRYGSLKKSDRGPIWSREVAGRVMPHPFPVHPLHFPSTGPFILLESFRHIREWMHGCNSKEYKAT